MIFISGSRSIRRMNWEIKRRMERIIDEHEYVLVGDAFGADLITQGALKGYENVTVYHSGPHPRINIGGWGTMPVLSKHRPGTRAYHTDKDKAMTQECDNALMLWDGVSIGTENNIERSISLNKRSTVIIKRRIYEVRSLAGFACLKANIKERKGNG